MDASLNRAEAACAQGRFDEAEALCRQVLADLPHEPVALNLLGIVAQRRNKPDDALNWFDAALTAKPDFLQARYNRSVILRVLDRKDDALEGVKASIQQAPDFAEAWDLAGQLFLDRGAFGDAEKCFSHATGLQPQNSSFWANFGLLRYAQGDFLGCYKTAKKAESLDPKFPPFLLGNVLNALGYPEEAADCFARAQATPALTATAAASEAMARLQIGDYERGFALWEKRPVLAWRHSQAPLWDGTNIDTLLLYEDQGFGDAIQFLRFVPWVKSRANDIVLCLRAPLVSLCAQQFSDIRVCAEGDLLPPVDARCRLSSLPSLAKTTLPSIPKAPYFAVPRSPERDQRLQNIRRPRIGIAWAGNAQFRNDWNRSISFKSLAPILDNHAHFVSLQIGGGKEAANAGLFDAAPQLHSFADTATFINELDLVISVDTAIAHLAGALGKPVFILLPFNSDWRWLLGRADSPWYATAKLFRQPSPGDWGTVIDAVAADIEKFLQGNAKILKAAPWVGDPLRQHPQALPLP